MRLFGGTFQCSSLLVTLLVARTDTRQIYHTNRVHIEGCKKCVSKMSSEQLRILVNRTEGWLPPLRFSVCLFVFCRITQKKLILAIK